jgi:hypothetical protein
LMSDPFFQVVCATLWLSVFFMVQQRFRPYEGSLFNKVESMVLGDLFVTVAVSLLLLQSTTAKNATPTEATLGEVLVTVFLMLINIGALCVLVAVWFRAGCKHALDLPIVKKAHAMLDPCYARVSTSCIVPLQAGAAQMLHGRFNRRVLTASTPKIHSFSLPEMKSNPIFEQKVARMAVARESFMPTTVLSSAEVAKQNIFIPVESDKVSAEGSPV